MQNDTHPECRIAAECLAGRVRVLNRVVTGIYDDALRPHRVRVSQMNVLVAIAAMGPVRAADVCRELRLDKSTLSRDLDRLLDRGWVRTTPADGRVKHLEATPTGRALIKKVMPAWEEAQKRVHEILGPELARRIFDVVDGFQAADFDRG
ncbi:MAG: MarR family transcriptional regulator [Gemmataceae bacterium]|nr:MarR family transcriptional regulator [Gemmataceae bacterium]